MFSSYLFYHFIFFFRRLTISLDESELVSFLSQTICKLNHFLKNWWIYSNIQRENTYIYISLALLDDQISFIKSNSLSKFYFGENRTVTIDRNSPEPRKRKSNARILTQQSGEWAKHRYRGTFSSKVLVITWWDRLKLASHLEKNFLPFSPAISDFASRIRVSTVAASTGRAE